MTMIPAPFFPRLLAVTLMALFAVCAPVNASGAERRMPVALSAPATVYDGTAFLCELSGPEIKAVTFSFLGRSVKAKATPNTQAAATNTFHAKALLPIPLNHPAQTQSLTWTASFADGSTAMGNTPITIKTKTYPVQKLSLQAKYVTPDPALTERIRKESERMRAAFTTLTDTAHWTLQLERPVPGRISSPFGVRRVLNKEPRGFHRGVDFAAPAGAPIKAVANGTVILTGDFYYPGQFVAIDHGQGLVTVSMHMSEILAEQGQSIKRGDTIGLVGSTGRSTGPHLHLSLFVLGQSVDALPLLTPGPEPDPVLSTPPAPQTPARKTTAPQKQSGKRKKAAER